MFLHGAMPAAFHHLYRRMGNSALQEKGVFGRRNRVLLSPEDESRLADFGQFRLEVEINDVGR